MLRPLQEADLERLPYMAAILLWVAAWETMGVLGRLNRLKLPRDLEVEPLVELMMLLAVETHIRDKTNNTSTPNKEASPVPVKT